MKPKIFLLSMCLICFACKEKTSKTTTKAENDTAVSETIYPENLSKMFDAHGGIGLWKQMQTLKFTILEDDGSERVTVDLKSRKSVIDMPNHVLGYNGKEVWLLNKDTISYKGDPKFYNNLMFYFFAMPFVMADNGIKYGEAQPLTVNGKTYQGIKVTFESGIGESPDDEYLLYYESNTNKLIWLSYTVTFFSKEKSTKFNNLKYSNWRNVNGLLMPETMEWNKIENGIPTPIGKVVKFVDIKISNQKMASEFFEKPENASTVE